MNEYDKLWNAIKSYIDQRFAAHPVGRWGVITSVDPVNHLVKCTVEPDHSDSIQSGGEPITTGWLQYLTHGVSNTAGMVSLPDQGQQVFWMPEYGDAEHGVALGGAYSTQNPAPQSLTAIGGAASAVQPGEFLYGNSSGSIRISKNGTIYISAKSMISIDAPEVRFSGNVVVLNGATAFVPTSDGGMLQIVSGIAQVQAALSS